MYIYIYITLYMFKNLCGFPKRMNLLHLIFWALIFSPARVVPAMKVSK